VVEVGGEEDEDAAAVLWKYSRNRTTSSYRLVICIIFIILYFYSLPMLLGCVVRALARRGMRAFILMVSAA
jgi:hypothetical protein